MSRLERRLLTTNNDQQVRLFAWSDFQSGYRVVFSPPSPVIIFRSKRTQDHPTRQWNDFATKVFARNPDTHAVFLLDATQLGEAAFESEASFPTALGSALKPISRVLKKLHPTAATVLSVGPSSNHMIKLLQQKQQELGDAVERLVLVVSRREDVALIYEYETPVKVTLVPLNDQIRSQLSVNLPPNVTVSSTPSDLMNELCQICVTNVVCDRLPNRIEGPPMLYEITFVLSKYSKQVEQNVELISEPSGVPQQAQAESADEDESASESDGSNSGGVVSLPSRSQLLPCEFPNNLGSRVEIVAHVIDKTVVGDSQGRISIEDCGLTPGKAVRLNAQVGVKNGSLQFQSVTNIAQVPPKSSSAPLMCRAKEVPTFCHSTPTRSYGLALIRGRKIALARNPARFKGMRFPAAVLSNVHQSAFDCASKATGEALQVTQDNFYIRSDLPTFVFYPSPSECVTLFIAIATYEPPGGKIRDDMEEKESSDPYDWLTYNQAKKALKRPEEAEVLDQVVGALGRASKAGHYTPPWGLGLFGGAIQGSSTRRVIFFHGIDDATSGEVCKRAAAASQGKELSFDSKRHFAQLQKHFASSTAAVYITVPSETDLEELCFLFLPRVCTELWAEVKFVAVVPNDEALAEPISTATLAGGTPKSYQMFSSVERADAVFFLGSETSVVFNLVKLVNHHIPIFLFDDADRFTRHLSGNCDILPSSKSSANSNLTLCRSEIETCSQSWMASAAKLLEMGPFLGQLGIVHVSGSLLVSGTGMVDVVLCGGELSYSKAEDESDSATMGVIRTTDWEDEAFATFVRQHLEQQQGEEVIKLPGVN